MTLIDNAINTVPLSVANGATSESCASVVERRQRLIRRRQKTDLSENDLTEVDLSLKV